MKRHKAKPGADRSRKGACCKSQAGHAPTSRRERCEWLVLVVLLVLFSGLPISAAEKNKDQVDLLVARNEVQDPYFHQSVVLLLPETQTQLVVGLIVNKRTHLTVGKLFPDTPELQGRTESAYFGGPVAIRTPSIVFRSSTASQNAIKLYGKVYLTFDSDQIIKSFQGPKADSRTRLFLGRAQWAPGQLQNEIQRGSWYRIQADGNLVFSSNPENLWSTLHSRSAPSKYIRYDIPPDSNPTSTRKAAEM